MAGSIIDISPVKPVEMETREWTNDESMQIISNFLYSNSYSPGFEDVFGLDGYYECEGHSVEPLLQSYVTNDSGSHDVPLDLSCSSKQLSENLNALDYSTNKPNGIQQGQEVVDLSSKPKNNKMLDSQISNEDTLEGRHLKNDDALLSTSESPVFKHETELTAVDEIKPILCNKKPQYKVKRPCKSSDNSKTKISNQSKLEKKRVIENSNDCSRSASKRSRSLSRSKREEPSQCSFCNKWFCSSWSRLSHERTHTGQNRFYCKVCHRSFPNQHNHARNKDGQIIPTKKITNGGVSEKSKAPASSDEAVANGNGEQSPTGSIDDEATSDNSSPSASDMSQ